LLATDGAAATRALLAADPHLVDLTVTAASLEDALDNLSNDRREAA
jgi:hypothetical protein